MNSKFSKYNRIWIGFIVGLIFPILGLLVLYLFDSSYHSLSNFFILSYKLGVMTNLLSISLLANLIAFYFFLNKEWYYAVRGVMIAVLIWGAVILFIRLTIPEL